MDHKKIFASQYRASLAMLKECIHHGGCKEIWYDESFKNKYWHIAYHVLFYTDLYLSVNEQSFNPWEKHRKDYQFMGKMPFPPHGEPEITDAYTPNDIMQYFSQIESSITERLDSYDLDAPSGFSWLSFSKYELQIYNIRHIQHHAAQLASRLSSKKDIVIEWVGAVER